jgi:hypothetical protein
MLWLMEQKYEIISRGYVDFFDFPDFFNVLINKISQPQISKTPPNGVNKAIWVKSKSTKRYIEPEKRMVPKTSK